MHVFALACPAVSPAHLPTPHFAADPAAEAFKYPVSIDVRDLVTLDDVMEEMQLGPNGCVGGCVWVCGGVCVWVCVDGCGWVCVCGWVWVCVGGGARMGGKVLVMVCMPSQAPASVLHSMVTSLHCPALLLPRSRSPPCSGLLYCMEYLEDNLEEWLGGELEPYGDDDYLLFDCPGQIELYSHLSVFRTFVEFLHRDGWQICAVRGGRGLVWA